MKVTPYEVILRVLNLDREEDMLNGELADEIIAELKRADFTIMQASAAVSRLT